MSSPTALLRYSFRHLVDEIFFDREADADYVPAFFEAIDNGGLSPACAFELKSRLIELQESMPEKAQGDLYTRMDTQITSKVREYVQSMA